MPPHARPALDHESRTDPDQRDREGAPEPVVPHGVLALQRSAGNAAVSRLLQRQPTVVQETGEVDVSEKDDDLLARTIISQERAILGQWNAALDIFNEVLKSESDAASKPDFQKATIKFFADKVMGKIAEKGGAGTPFELFGKLEEEYKRAQAAGDSARIRDFYVTHKAAVADLDKKLALIADDFEARAKKAYTLAETGDQKALDDYGMMRMQLVEVFQDTEARLRQTSTSQLYTLLSEEWINASDVYAGMGIHTDAKVIIRIWDDLSIRDAYVQGTGGQKIAEQMMKNSPGGVDVWGLKVKREIKVFEKGGNGWPVAIVMVDENGRSENRGSIAEGRSDLYHRRIEQAGGLPPITKDFKGED
jgi:hypothetical protein